jgi:hypothetical protein
MHPALDKETKCQLRKYIQSAQDGRVSVEYNFGKEWQTSEMGRVYANRALGYQSFWHEIRNALASEYYDDIDIVNCHPVILAQICKGENLSCPNLDYYVSHRDQVLAEMQYFYKVDRDTAKQLFIRVLYLGHLEILKSPIMPFVFELQTEMHNIAKYISINNPNVYKICQKIASKKDRNVHVYSSTIAVVLQSIEHSILMGIVSYLTNAGFTVGALIFDGCHVEKVEGASIPECILRECEANILSTIHFKIQLAKKPMSTTLKIDNLKEAPSIESWDDIKKILKDVSTDYLQKKDAFETVAFKCTCPTGYYVKIRPNHFHLYSPVGIVQAYLQYQVTDSDGKTSPFIRQWMNDPDINTYEYVDEIPPPLVCPNDTFNLWTGFDIASNEDADPSAGNINMFVNHINILTENIPEHSIYFQKFLAQIIQQPGKPTGISPVFISKQGSGKNRFFDMFKLILGEIDISKQPILKLIFSALFLHSGLGNL